MIQLQLFIAILLFFSCFCELVTVKTSRGAVQGIDHHSGKDTTKRFYGYGQIFLGIPFAKPPVGERRFSLPEDISHYNDRGEMHNATYYRPRCLQKGKRNVAEDCLYLNVMTPSISGHYPVMVYIHGGTFTTGGADTFHWKGAIRNLLSRGVVVVTIQYRISMLGFFTTFTENFPPNRGFYDQIMALRWVNEEIANFGGDATRVTLFGQSAGASSVSDLSLSPLARGLFHQIIQESGSAMQQLETIDNPIGSIHQFRAEQICKINSTNWGSPEKDRELLDCLLKVPAKDLVKFDYTAGLNWAVAIDVPGVMNRDLSYTGPKSAEFFLRSNLPYLDDDTAKIFSHMMIDRYSDGVIPAEDDHLGWAKLTTDTMTDVGTVAMLLTRNGKHEKAGNKDVWLFTFAYRSMLPFGVEVDSWMPVGHSSELPYLWFYPDCEIWETYNATDADFAIAEYMGALWTTFAKNG